MLEITRKNIRIWSMLGMRRVLGVAISSLAEVYDDLVFMTADVGRYFGIDDYKRLYPDRYIDVGIAEQNLVGVAAGAQKEGMNVFAATYATFLTSRALDQVRVALGYMKLGVKLIGVGGGLAEGDLSATHMGLEDIANIRAIPNIAIVSPADALELVKALHAMASYAGPAYLRLTGRTSLVPVYTADYHFEIGRSICLREGEDVAIVATGCIVSQALKAADILADQGIYCRVVDMHTIRPLDEAELERISRSRMLVTVEEHNAVGGLGAAIAEYYADKPKRPMHHIIALKDDYPPAGEYEHLLERCGLTGEEIAASTAARLKEHFAS